MKLTWDETGQKRYETGVKRGVLFNTNSSGNYLSGIAWNGLTGVTESSSGAEETVLWADDLKYASLRSAEEFGLTIEAYQFPPEFKQCDGMADIATGVTVNQQGRRGFGFSYTTTVGNDVQGNDYGEKIHLVYGCTASPSEKAYQTINDSPDGMSLSWEVTTTPISVLGRKPTSHLIIDSTRCDKAMFEAFKEVLYGTGATSSRLQKPHLVVDFFSNPMNVFEVTATAQKQVPTMDTSQWINTEDTQPTVEINDRVISGMLIRYDTTNYKPYLVIDVKYSVPGDVRDQFSSSTHIPNVVLQYSSGVDISGTSGDLAASAITYDSVADVTDFIDTYTIPLHGITNQNPRQFDWEAAYDNCTLFVYMTGSRSGYPTVNKSYSLRGLTDSQGTYVDVD